MKRDFCVKEIKEKQKNSDSGYLIGIPREPKPGQGDLGPKGMPVARQSKQATAANWYQFRICIQRDSGFKSERTRLEYRGSTMDETDPTIAQTPRVLVKQFKQLPGRGSR